MTKKKMYFGHPIGLYNTQTESELIKIIRETFPDYEVENPNQPHHQTRAKQLAEETGNKMEYFFKEYIPQMDAGVFLAWHDGMFGCGVYDEAIQLLQENKQIYEITFDKRIFPMKQDDSRRLSIPETVARNKKERPST